jgi:two-component system, NtrC family, sensor kinase
MATMASAIEGKPLRGAGALPGHLPYYYGVPMALGAVAVALAVSSAVLWAGVLLAVAVASLIGTHQLLTRIRQSHQQKCFLDEQLIQSQKLAAIGELSSGIAHEINNPLAIISQEMEWVQHLMRENDLKDFKGADEFRDSLREIARQVDRCREITHRLLNFARKMEPLMQRVDINKLIEDMTRLVEREAVHKNVTIVRNFQADLPAVNTDAPLIRQVILNLLNNAVYAIGHDGAVTLTTRTVENSGIEIVVRDTGCGIPREHLDKIFNPFFTTKPPGKGTGLGLSICHGIVDKLGGHIGVSSEVGKGTTFSIRLPL